MDFAKPGPNKRVCSFLFDSLLVQTAGMGMTVIIGAEMTWIVALVGILLRDVVDGQSPGRRFVGLQVIDEASREPAAPFATILRNILMVIPILPIVEYFVMRNDKAAGQRLGDRMAKTLVTDLKPQEADKKYLWMSLGLVVVFWVVVVIFATLLARFHPELLPKRSA